MTAATSERVHALDAVRGFALLLGIVFHSTVPFLPVYSYIPWVVMDSRRSLVLAGLFFVAHVFRMVLFFLLAGFFARMSFHRKGLRGFILDRLERIALPLAIAWPFTFLLVHLFINWGLALAHLRPLPLRLRFPNIPLAHLWFLYLLLWFYTIWLALRGLSQRLRAAHPRLDGVVNALVRATMVSGPLGSAVLAVPLGALIWWLVPRWRAWFGIPTPDLSLLPPLGPFLWYMAAFVFGWLLHRQGNLLQLCRSRWPFNLTVALLSMLALILIEGITPTSLPIYDPARRALFAVCYTLAAWSTSFALLGLALRYFSAPSFARRYVADSSYWLFLVHLPVVMCVQLLVAPLDWPWPVKFLCIETVTFLLLFASYQLFVRYTIIGRVLNGVRQRRSQSVASLETAAQGNAAAVPR